MPRPRLTQHLWEKPLPNGDVFHAFKIGLNYHAFIHRVSRMGLRWRPCAESTMPTHRQLKNRRLAEALQTKTTFDVEEWRSFGMRAPEADEWIRSPDGRCFQPSLHDVWQVACTASRSSTALRQNFADRALAQKDARERM